MKTFGVSTNSYTISVPILFVIILSYFGHRWPSWLLSFVLNHGLGEFIELYTYLWLWSWCTMQGCFEVGILLRFAKREQIDTPHESTWKLQLFTPEFESVGIPFIIFNVTRWRGDIMCAPIKSIPVVCHLMGIDLNPMVLESIYHEWQTLVWIDVEFFTQGFADLRKFRFKKYSWWRRFCTIWDVHNAVNNGINYL